MLVIIECPTFNSAGDVEEASLGLAPDVPSAQPAVLIYCFLGLLVVIQVTHEHMAARHADLQRSNNHVIVAQTLTLYTFNTCLHFIHAQTIWFKHILFPIGKS
jgi:hypothetical protein